MCFRNLSGNDTGYSIVGETLTGHFRKSAEPRTLVRTATEVIRCGCFAYKRLKFTWQGRPLHREFEATTVPEMGKTHSPTRELPNRGLEVMDASSNSAKPVELAELNRSLEERVARLCGLASNADAIMKVSLAQQAAITLALGKCQYDRSKAQSMFAHLKTEDARVDSDQAQVVLACLIDRMGTVQVRDMVPAKMLPFKQELVNRGAIIQDGVNFTAESWFIDGYQRCVDPVNFIDQVVKTKITASNASTFYPSLQQRLRYKLGLSRESEKVDWTPEEEEDVTKHLLFTKVETPEGAPPGAKKVFTVLPIHGYKAHVDPALSALKKVDGLSCIHRLQGFLGAKDISYHDAILVASFKTMESAIMHRNNLGRDTDLNRIHLQHFAPISKGTELKSLRLKPYAVKLLKEATPTWTERILSLTKEWSAEEIERVSGRARSVVIASDSGTGKGHPVKGKPKTRTVDTPTPGPSAKPAPDHLPKEGRISRADFEAREAGRRVPTARRPRVVPWCLQCGEEGHWKVDKRDDTFCAKEYCGNERRNEVKRIIDEMFAALPPKPSTAAPKTAAPPAGNPVPPPASSVASVPGSPPAEGRTARRNQLSSLEAEIAELRRAIATMAKGKAPAS
jgi:hypothetical protein